MEEKIIKLQEMPVINNSRASSYRKAFGNQEIFHNCPNGPSEFDLQFSSIILVWVKFFKDIFYLKASDRTRLSNLDFKNMNMIY